MLPTAVILPNGRLDFDAAHLIPPDVPLEPVEVNPRDAIHLPFEVEEIVRWGELVEGMDSDEWTAEQMVILGKPEWQFRHYVRMRIDGQSRSMADMLSAKSFPGVKTDSVFNEGKFSGQSSGPCAAHEAWLRRQAEAAGVSVNGKWYCSGLASFPGDPTAWVDSRGDVLRIAREKNMTVHGYVEHKGHEVDRGEDVEIAGEMIDDEVSDILDANPGANADAVREQVYKLRTGRVDPNPLHVKD